MNARKVQEELVLRAARQYGRMVKMGVYVENGHLVHPSAVQEMDKYFQKELLREAEHYVALVGCLSKDGEIEE